MFKTIILLQIFCFNLSKSVFNYYYNPSNKGVYLLPYFNDHVENLIKIKPPYLSVTEDPAKGKCIIKSVFF